MKTLLDAISASPWLPRKPGWPTMQCGAIFSDCGAFRYVLWRIWSPGTNFAHLTGLNPSTADHTTDDPTVTREIDFAMSWGADGLIKTNAFAFRATDPRVMKAAADPIGPENDQWIQRAVYLARPSLNVACWGTHGIHRERNKTLLARFGWHCFGQTKGGHPKHPLYLSKTTKLERLLNEPE